MFSPLTKEEVNLLPDDTQVEIIWSGGNGPHTYKIATDKWGNRRIRSLDERRGGLDESVEGSYIGEYPLTVVRLV